MQIMEISLRHNSGVALVDAADYLSVQGYDWMLMTTKNGHKYAQAYKDRKTFLMHRVILRADKKQIVDHVDGNGLNNTRSNIRLCNNSQNQANRRPCGKSKFLGVWYDKGKNRRKRWVAEIRKNFKRVKAQRFFTEEEAARTYDVWARRIHGKFANCNFQKKIKNSF